MAKIIYKYPLNQYSSEIQTLSVPKGRVLKVDEQGGVLFAWMLTDTDEDIQPYKFQVIETGQELQDLGRLEIRHHLNSVVMPDSLVWHVFQILKVSPKQ